MFLDQFIVTKFFFRVKPKQYQANSVNAVDGRARRYNLGTIINKERTAYRWPAHKLATLPPGGYLAVVYSNFRNMRVKTTSPPWPTTVSSVYTIAVHEMILEKT